MGVPVRGVVAVGPHHVVAATDVSIVINVPSSLSSSLFSIPLESRCSGGFRAWKSLGCGAGAFRGGRIQEGQDRGRVW